MKLKFKCQCGKILMADPAAAGKKAKCPHCGQVVQVPRPQEAKPPASNSPASTSQAKPTQPKSPQSVPKPQPAVAKPAPAKPPEPAPFDFDDDLGLEPLENLPPPALKGSTPASKPVAAATSQKATGARTVGRLPTAPTKPESATSSASNPALQEDEPDAYGLKAEPDDTCPKCGKPMPPQAVLCVSCGYNRKTGASVSGIPAPPDGKAVAKMLVDKLTTKKPATPAGGLSGKLRLSRNMLRIVVACIAGGIALAGYGLKEKKLADSSSAQPETVTLQQLIQRGPEGNPNVSIKEFQPCRNIVYETKTVAGIKEGNWSAVWVPVVVPQHAAAAQAADPQPASTPNGDNGNPQTDNSQAANPVATNATQSAQPTATNVQAIVYSTHIGNEQELTAKLGVPILPGMVINRIQTLPDNDKQLLQQSYLNINFDKCVIFEEGRTPSSTSQVMLFLAGGGALILVGLGLGAKGFFLG